MKSIVQFGLKYSPFAQGIIHYRKCISASRNDWFSATLRMKLVVVVLEDCYLVASPRVIEVDDVDIKRPPDSLFNQNYR
jgi:hypothetical protein